MKHIQIDAELFLKLYLYFCNGENDEDTAEEIRQQIDAKLDKMLARQLFTEYKRAATPAEREKARQEYLNHANIQKDYRTDTETPYGKI